MRIQSLRLRLLFGASLAIFITLAVAWLAMSLLFERHLERRVQSELRRDAATLISDLSFDDANTPIIGSSPADPRYQTPTGGLYWQISTQGSKARSRSLWDDELPTNDEAPADRWQTTKIEGPFGQSMVLVERDITVGNDGPISRVQFASSEAELIIAMHEFGVEIAYFLGLLWLALSAAAWLQVHLGLIPLRTLRSQLQELHQNPANRLGEEHPSEVEPLVNAINDLAAARESDLRRARQRAADLAHGMKTPLSALTAQSRLIKSGKSDPNLAAEGMDRAIAWAAAAIEAELARSRAAESRASRQKGSQTYAGHLCRRIIGVLERTEKGRLVEFRTDISDEIYLPIRDADTSEILGPLLENAVEFANRLVLVRAGQAKRIVWLSIEDDGPGMSRTESAAALARGVRLDEVGVGHGLGLAIAKELTEATGGVLELSRSEHGGLSVRLEWSVPETNYVLR